MKVALLSDTHGIILPPIDPSTDFIIHAGDITPDKFFQTRDRRNAHLGQMEWLENEFQEWKRSNGDIEVYATWGNHDFIGEKIGNYNHNGIHILQNKQIDLYGLKTYFSPWVTHINGTWAFETRSDLWSTIPDDTQVVVTHSPPKGLGDLVVTGHANWGLYDSVGSAFLLQRLLQLKDLRLVVCGHIHEGRGLYLQDKLDAPVYNVAVVNERYLPVHDPVAYLEWPTDGILEGAGYGFGV